MFDYALPAELMTTLIFALIVLNAVWVYELYSIKRTIFKAATIIANEYKIEEEDDDDGSNATK